MKLTRSARGRVLTRGHEEAFGLDLFPMRSVIMLRFL